MSGCVSIITGVGGADASVHVCSITHLSAFAIHALSLARGRLQPVVVFIQNHLVLSLRESVTSVTRVRECVCVCVCVCVWLSVVECNHHIESMKKLDDGRVGFVVASFHLAQELDHLSF